MAGKKENMVVAVIGNLTDVQAAELTKEIVKAKKQYAATAAGTIAIGKKVDVGRILQDGHRAVMAITGGKR